MTETFMIAPAGTRPLWVLVPAGLLMAAVLCALLLSLYGSRAARFEVSAAGLRLRGDFYGRFIPADQLRAAEARRVDLAREPSLRLRLRTLGTGLPGYQAGWFRLAGGGKALVYLTDRSRAVHVPTRRGYSVIVTPADPDAFVESIRRLSATRTR
ncbi:MAG: PH domain-containing protein [Gemmatimonadota bacterium]